MPTYNDGGVPYGFAGVAELFQSPGGALIGSYVIESLTFDEGGFQIDRRNGLNVMSGRVAGDDNSATTFAIQAKTGTIRIQRATPSTPAPKVGNGIGYNGGNLDLPDTFLVVTGATQNLAQAEAHTFECRFAVTSVEI